MTSNLSILVNTCDKFEDCWDPFFKLFSIYWPDFDGKIYLNTEYKDYSFSGLEIIAVKGCERNEFPKNKRATWSQCLKWALDIIDNDIVLYMQEDYFLKDFVKNDIVANFKDVMKQNDDIDCIHLTDQGPAIEEPSSRFNALGRIPLGHRDRISCQTALWRRDVLLKYLQPYESGWSFEWWGSKRASIYKHNFYGVDKNWIQLNKFEIIPYIFTGVIGGKWYKEVVPLFEQHDIEIDFETRGFFQRQPVNVNNRIRAKLKRLPIEIKSSIHLFQLKLKLLLN